MESIRIVLASPSDLKDERTLITNIINITDKRFKKQGITLDLRRWEDTPPGANFIGGQGTIDDDLEIADADIFICLYWKKIGTIIEGLDETGTEHELNIAIDSFKRNGKPDIKFFLKKTNVTEGDENYSQIMDIAKKIQPLALYKEFDSLDELKNVIEEILFAEFFKKNTESVISNDKEKTYVEADTELKLLESIASDQRIILHNKFYDVLSAKPTSKNIYLNEVFDGHEIIIEDITNFALIGDESKIITNPRYATVLTFRRCDNITLSNLFIGHTPHKGECVGAVLSFIECNNVVLNNLELFGCGTYGLDLHNSNNIVMNGCHIYECSYGGIFMESSDLFMKNSIISDCHDLAGCVLELNSSYINMKNVLITKNTTENCIFALTDSNIYGEAITICKNRYGRLGRETDGLSLNNNIQLYWYPAEINSVNSTSHEIYEEELEYISQKSRIIKSLYDNEKFSIQFEAPNMETIKEYSEHYSDNPNIQLGCG